MGYKVQGSIGLKTMQQWLRSCSTKDEVILASINNLLEAYLQRLQSHMMASVMQGPQLHPFTALDGEVVNLINYYGAKRIGRLFNTLMQSPVHKNHLLSILQTLPDASMLFGKLEISGFKRTPMSQFLSDQVALQLKNV